MATEESDPQSGSTDDELELEGAREFVIKERCEDILEARRKALDALSKYHSLRQEAAHHGDVEELDTHVAGLVWGFAFESKQLLSQTEAGTDVWESHDLGVWQVSEPQVDETVRNVLSYRIPNRGETRGQAPVLQLHGVAEFVDLAPPVSVQATVEVLPSGRHSPSPETRTVTYRQSPPREILVEVFDAVDGVIGELGLAPEVQPAEDDAKIDYEDLI